MCGKWVLQFIFLTFKKRSAFGKLECVVVIYDFYNFNEVCFKKHFIAFGV
jgi:hypothetical protein